MDKLFKLAKPEGGGREMKCPVCAEPLSPYSYAAQIIDVCHTCGGAWFDPMEMGPVITELAKQEDIQGLQTKDALTSEAPKQSKTEQQKLCPRCNIPTLTFNYSYDSGIFLNRCPSCEGIWVDPGELRRLAQYAKGNPAIQAFAKELALHNKKKTSRFHRFLTSRPLSGCVAGFYFAIAWIFGGAEMAVKVVSFLLLPLACIWFSDAMGNCTGFLTFTRPAITEKSPGILVAFIAWLLLLSPLFIAVVTAVSH